MTDLTILFQFALLDMSFENPVTEVEMTSGVYQHLRPKGNLNERGNRSASPEMAMQKGKP
jgi:hypothetical protein